MAATLTDGAGRNHDVLVAVLAGGAGRRMAAEGLGPKPFAALAGRPLVAHVLGRMAAQAGRLAVNVARVDGRWAALGVPLIPDEFPGEGPLGGVLSVLRWAGRQAAVPRLVITVPVDAPFLPADLVGRLGARDGAAVARSGGRDHFAVAAWPPARTETVAAAFRTGTRALRPVLAALGAEAAAWDDAPYDPFLNVNDAAGLRRAEIVLGMFEST